MPGVFGRPGRRAEACNLFDMFVFTTLLSIGVNSAFACGLLPFGRSCKGPRLAAGVLALFLTSLKSPWSAGATNDGSIARSLMSPKPSEWYDSFPRGVLINGRAILAR